MSDSSNDQSEPKMPNTKSAIIWAAVIGMVTVGLVFWILSTQSIVTRLIAGTVSGVAVAISSYRKSVATIAKSGGEPDDDSV
ncbi:hypothetical protein A9Q96_02270 [Rhodobacterales bacterium 52_120_T64]|nr:hypothetical protein A9Q96_02270 [Rhodobacterales bacterium 52_120_T64]